jgi:flavin reductase (DIM6/NTAB) family NADH-FMN oxidoreductase RutF
MLGANNKSLKALKGKELKAALKLKALSEGKGEKAPSEGQSPSPATEIPATTDDVDDVDLDAATLRNDVRSLMRQVPSSVAVITVASVDPELRKNVPMGVAVSSLSTVTLDPPTISFNIKQPSKTLDAIRAAKGRFRVHFPAADRGGARLVEHFCNGNHPESYAARNRYIRIYVPRPSDHADRLSPSASGAPQIFADYVHAAMECSLTQELQVADHVILVARIDTMESKKYAQRTISYVDGMYLSPDGTRLTSHAQPVVQLEDDWSIWDYPVCPGDKERHDYVERIKAIAKKNPQLLELKRENIRDLELKLPLSPGTLGINLDQVLDEVRQESGKPSELPSHMQHASALSEFWGRLTPSVRAKIYERAQHLVEKDVDFLNLNYRAFLSYLGVSVASIDLLPSDIMEHLRAAKLVGPFHPRAGPGEPVAYGNKSHTISYLEQVERQLEKHLATMSNAEATKVRLEDVMELLGEPKASATYFKKSQGRLITAALPTLFARSKIDILGEVSPEEARVMMRRVISFLDFDSVATLTTRITKETYEILRRVGVDPTITGFNVEFFFAKLRHLHFSTRFARKLPERVKEMLDPRFADTITWDDLEKRVKDFVHKTPMRAMLWSRRDKLAALGLYWEATLTVPIAENNQPLNRGHILETLVAKELKALHASCAPELKQDIAHYLKEQYDFDIDVPLPTEDHADIRSSNEDMQAAMIASRNIDVTRGRRDEEEPDDALSRQSGGGLPRKQIMQSISWRRRTPNQQQNSSQKKSTWTSYSLGGARKSG